MVSFLVFFKDFLGFVGFTWRFIQQVISFGFHVLCVSGDLGIFRRVVSFWGGKGFAGFRV